MSKKMRNILVALVALTIALFSLGFARAKLASTSPSEAKKPTTVDALETKKPTKPGLAPQGKSDNSEIQSALLTLRPHGFEPNEFTRPAGRLLLLVDNRSELPEMVLRIDRVVGNDRRVQLPLEGNVAKELHVKREQLDWHNLIDLTPGEYVLSETSHPEWVCHVTITPK